MTNFQMTAIIRRISASFLIAIMLGNLFPFASWAADAVPAGAVNIHSRPAKDMPKNPVKRVPRTLTKIVPQTQLSTNPSDAEIKKARLLPEPLIPMSGPIDADDNRALALALSSFKSGATANIGILKNFVAQHPNSRWKASLELNLGLIQFDRGYMSDSLKYWKSAWELSKNEQSSPQRDVADRSIAELQQLHSRLGRLEDLKEYFAEIKGRKVSGTVDELLYEARVGQWCMERHPERAFKCGPFALNMINNINLAKPIQHPMVEATPSSRQGTNLLQLKNLAKKMGLNYQVARKDRGVPWMIPAVVHWKLDHFGAIVGKEGEKYHVKDTTFADRGNLWAGIALLDHEADGYALVPAGKLAAGWHAVTDADAAKIWGKGNLGSTNGNQMTPCAPTLPARPKQPKRPASPPAPEATGTPSLCSGMPVASAFAMQATLNIVDIPLEYSPPVGPQIGFRINYNYMETNQPTTYTFTNFGANWTIDWLSYLTVDSSQNVLVRVRGGGSEAFLYNGSSLPYYPDVLSQALIVSTGTNTYERRLPDGTVEVFDQVDGSGRIFLTEIVDPQGNSALVQYDSDFRITGIIDALGQQSTFTYVSNSSGNPGFYKVAQITDPFSRSCSFTYDSSSTYMTGITDVVGMASSFTYNTSNSQIVSMTTPYGTTSFYQFQVIDPYSALAMGIRISYPDGTSSAISTKLEHTGESYYWDRNAMALYPTDLEDQVYTHCKTYAWFFSGTAAPFVLTAVARTIKDPLENITTYGYTNQWMDIFLNPAPGTINQPITVTRSTSAGNQVWSYTYNSLGAVTQTIDPLGREFSYTYASNNVDLTAVSETKGSNDYFMGGWTYNTHHRPLTSKDGSGQTTTYTYNSFQELLTVTDANSNVTTMTYDSDGYLIEIDGPLSGTNDKTTFTYDGFGRVYTVTDSEGYTLTYNYDDLNRVTQVSYPDGTFEKSIYDKLDAVLIKDRLGRWTERAYDSMDQLKYEIDPLGRKTQYSWCACGSISGLTDPAGNTTTWDHDVQGRVITKTYEDNSDVNYTYDTVGRLSTRTDALNQVATYSYNLDNTLSQVAYTSSVHSTPNVTYTYDANYPRISTVVNSWGTLTYTYNAYITNPPGTPITGGGRLASVANNAISNSTITYTYDALGRTTNRSIDGSNNSDTWTYDAMSRITGENNELGSWTYNYVDNTSGSSKGTLRLSSIQYPNSQVTNFSYYDNNGDQRLKQIENLNPSSVLLSKFAYQYNPSGEITQWQQEQNGLADYYNLEYDKAGQLIAAKAGSGSPQAPYGKQYFYNYDVASNRKAVQNSTMTTVRIGGTVTASDTITLTVLDSGLSGGQEAVVYTVQSGDTLNSIAAGLAAAITSNANLMTLGVNAVSDASAVYIKSVSPNLTSYTKATSGGATETATFGIYKNAIINASLSGSKTTGDVWTLTVKDSALSGGAKNVNYTVQSSDTLTTIASSMATAVNADTALQAIGVSASSAATVLALQSTSSNLSTYSSAVSGAGTEIVTLTTNPNSRMLAKVGGTKTTSDVLSIVVYDSALSGGSRTVDYTVQSGDTLTSIATGIASALNGDSNLQAAGVTASASGTVVTMSSLSPNATSYAQSVSSGATETIALFAPPPNGTQTAVIGGTKTTSDVLTVTVYDAGLSGGSKAINYTVQSGDTLTSIATNMASAINADTDLQSIAVTAASVGTVLNLKSSSTNLSTYVSSVSGGATETVTLGTGTGVTQATFNNVNELTGLSAGGPALFQASTNKAIKSASANSTPATLESTQSFQVSPPLSSGNNDVTVNATDGANNTTSNHYQTSLKGAGSTTLTYDANGNMTSDGTNTFDWDAENRLLKIIYPGSGNNTQFTYDPLGRCAKIVETVASSVTSTKQFVWCGSQRCEERDGSGSLSNGKQFYPLGQVNFSSGTPTNYFYTQDHLGSTREMTNSAGAIQAQYQYDPYGITTKLQGSQEADFQYAGYYMHAPSGLNLTMFRAYNPNLGRWLSRDPLEEEQGTNLYAYIDNDPLSDVDPLGLGKITVIYKALNAVRNQAGNIIGFAEKGSVSAKQAKNIRLKGGDVGVVCKDANKAKQAAKELEEAAFGKKGLDDRGVLHHPKGEHGNSRGHYQQRSNRIWGHTFYSLVTAFTLSGTLGESHPAAQVVDFFNPASDVAELMRITGNAGD